MDTHEEEWIAKYRAAVSIETMKRSRAAEILAAFQRACRVAISNLQKMSAIPRISPLLVQKSDVVVQPMQKPTLIPIQPISQEERASTVS